MIDGIDADGPTWRSLRKHIQREIASDQALLEQDLDQTDTTRIRGGIAKLRGLMADVESETMRHTGDPRS